MTTYNITITSDIVCPWCYIGHTRLSKAIESHKTQYPADKFNLTYRPFFLNPPPHTLSHTAPPPSFPVPSRPRQEMYAEKFGPDRAAQIERTMSQVSAAEGLSFKFGGMTGPSRNGHRLVRFAQGRGEDAQNQVMLGLWRRYFEREVDITRLDVLVDVGVEAGVGTTEEIRAFLESGEDGDEVDRLAGDARDDGITGVPHYVVGDLMGFGGAQEPRAFEMLFRRYKSAVGGGEKGEEGGRAGANGNGCL